MNLLDEVFQIDEVISECDTPVECFEWVLGEVLCLNVTIHTDVRGYSSNNVLALMSDYVLL